MAYSRWNNFLYFCDLLEDDRSKISHTKAMAWGGALMNYANMAYQFVQTHPDAAMLATSTLTHLLTAAKHELKRFNS